MAHAPLVERAGGPETLRGVLEDFYRRVLADRMIGFFFAGADPRRLVEKELELVLQALGDGSPYTGRPLAELHARHPIQGGQFMRRLKLLEETLVDHAVPPEVAEPWLRHNRELRAQITPDLPEQCEPRGKPGYPDRAR